MLASEMALPGSVAPPIISPRSVPPRIVVLDGYTLNPGDLSWAPLNALGTLDVFERSTPAELLERAASAQILITNKAVIDRAAILSLPELRYIGVTATGTNVVDRQAAQDRGVIVSNVPSYGADSVAEHTLGLMLEASKRFAEHIAAVRGGAWSRQPDFSFTLGQVSLLAGKTLGVVGLGAIGRRVAELALAFKMTVLAARREGAEGLAPAGIEQSTLDVLLARSDFVSLHCPLTDETARFINRARLALMKPSAILINTARGGLVDEPALAQALTEGRLAGAYLDVLSVEPPPPDHPLASAPSCRVTPHMAWASIEARSRLLAISIDNVRAFLSGQPVNVVR
jgi:glycerate dehydrogenase